MPTQNSISISLIITTCNRPKDLDFLLSCLQNVEILGRQDIEVIVVDNYPKNDAAKEICSKYRRVIFLKQPVPGHSLANNIGIQNAKGAFIAFTDDDVVIRDREWLDKLRKHFDHNPKLGYVSGNVKAIKPQGTIENVWERKGGLSKGNQSRLFTQKELRENYKMLPWPITKISAGANNMIPRHVLDQIGGFTTFLGGGAPLGHGNTLEIVYRIIRAGYDLYYDAEIVIYHKHPENAKALKQKLFLYGTGNSGYQLYIFMKYRDWRSLFYGLVGHHLYVLSNLLKSIFKKYPLPFSYTIHSLMGSLLGVPLFLYKYAVRNRRYYN